MVSLALLPEKEQITRLESRMRILSESMRIFTEATTDLDSLVERVAESLSSAVKDYCAVSLLSEDRNLLVPKAVFDSDPEVTRQAREVFMKPQRLVEYPIARNVIERREPFVEAHLDMERMRPPKTSVQYYETMKRLGAHSILIVPLVVQDRSIGQLVLLRFRPTSPPFDDGDLELAQMMASFAALAIANSRSYAAERSARDASDRAIAALRASEALHRSLYEEGPFPAFVIALDTLALLAVNEAALRLYGYTRSEFLNLNYADIRCSDDPGALGATVRAMGKLDMTGTTRQRAKDGTILFLEGRSHVSSFHGRPARFVVMNDITDRRRAEAALEHLREARATESNFGGFLESAPDAVVIVNSEGQVMLVNSQAEKMFGYPRSDLLERPVEVLVPERFRATRENRHRNYFRDLRARADNSSLELFGLRRNGSEFPIEIRLSELETPDGVLISGSIRDVTERKKVEEQRFLLAAIVESSDDAIIGVTLDGRITSWNSGAHRIFGYVASEMVGQTVDVLVPADHHDEELDMLRRVAAGEAVDQFDTVRLRKDGKEINVSMTNSPVRDPSGILVGSSKVVRDITERKRAEVALARAKDTAEAANRELEAFSYSVAHDLRAPLRGMNGFAQVLLDSYRDKLDAEGQDWLQEILMNARKMGALIDGLLALARLSRSEPKHEVVNLSALVRSAVSQLQMSEPNRKVEIVIEDGLHANLDPALAQALVENLLGNAWKFTAKTASPRIEFGLVEKDGEQRFFVRDNGAGFDMAYANKLFGPFQRLHTTAEFAGTGIGLATVQRIVRRHGGNIIAEGAVNAGATFYFSFADMDTGAAL